MKIIKVGKYEINVSDNPNDDTIGVVLPPNMTPNTAMFAFAAEIIKMRELLQAVNDAVSINKMDMFSTEVIALQDVQQYINSIPK